MCSSDATAEMNQEVGFLVFIVTCQQTMVTMVVGILVTSPLLV